jgi:hypothetical protein
MCLLSSSYRAIGSGCICSLLSVSGSFMLCLVLLSPPFSQLPLALPTGVVKGSVPLLVLCFICIERGGGIPGWMDCSSWVDVSLGRGVFGGELWKGVG